MKNGEAPEKEKQEGPRVPTQEEKEALRVSVPFNVWEPIVAYLNSRPYGEVKAVMPILEKGLPECECRKEKKSSLAPFAADRATKRRKGRAKAKS